MLAGTGDKAACQANIYLGLQHFSHHLTLEIWWCISFQDYTDKWIDRIKDVINCRLVPEWMTPMLTIHKSKLHNHGQDKFWLILHNGDVSTVDGAISICCRKAYNAEHWCVDANCQKCTLADNVSWPILRLSPCLYVLTYCAVSPGGYFLHC